MCCCCILINHFVCRGVGGHTFKNKKLIKSLSSNSYYARLGMNNGNKFLCIYWTIVDFVKGSTDGYIAASPRCFLNNQNVCKYSWKMKLLKLERSGLVVIYSATRTWYSIPQFKIFLLFLRFFWNFIVRKSMVAPFTNLVSISRLCNCFVSVDFFFPTLSLSFTGFTRLHYCRLCVPSLLLYMCIYTYTQGANNKTQERV